jgi:hypothetical protein
LTQAGSTFKSIYLPPDDLLSQLHGGFPKSSKYYNEPLRLTESCRKLGVDDVLLDRFRAVECLTLDSRDWIQDPQAHRFDALDIQAMWVLLAGQIIRRYLEMEEDGTLTPLEGIIGLSFLLYMGFVVRARVITLGGGTALIPRLCKWLSRKDGELMEMLRRHKLDIWVGVIIGLSSNVLPEYKDQMWSVYMEAITMRIPILSSASGLLRDLDRNAIWWPEKLDILVEGLWNYTRMTMTNKWPSSANLNPPESIKSNLRLDSTKISENRTPVAKNPYICGINLDTYLDTEDNDSEDAGRRYILVMAE